MGGWPDAVSSHSAAPHLLKSITPQPIIARLNKELREIVADPVVYALLRSFGFDAFTITPEQLGDFGANSSSGDAGPPISA